MTRLLDLLYLLGFLLASPWLVYRAIRGRGQIDLAARFGRVAAPAGCVWLHGSSVGEVSLLKPLLSRLAEVRPDLPIVITSHTATGVSSARLACPEATVFRFPVDFSFVQRRLMARLAPRAVVIVESDLWPNHLLAANRAGVPVAIINARLSSRSYRRHRFSRIVPLALRRVAVVAAQTAEHAARFAGLGVPSDRIVVAGNMKYDLTTDHRDATSRQALRAELGLEDRDVVIIGGSLHPAEDVDLLAAFAATRNCRQPTRLIIVPRYPEQAPAVIENAVRAGFRAIARSALKSRLPPDQEAAVVVVDTLGELRALYAAADIAFVGGSLYYRGPNKGGHNLMEPAILGLPVLFGPHNFSFRETVADLLAADAGILVENRQDLTARLVRLVDSTQERRDIGRRARQVVLEGQGASGRILELLLPLLDRAQTCGANAELAQCRHQTRTHILNE